MIVDPDFLDHWKTRLFIDEIGEDEAPLYLLRLWAHCQLRWSGRFHNLPAKAIKAICRFRGDERRLEEALITSGYIRRLDPKLGGDVLEVVGWEEKNKKLLKAKENGAKGGRPKKPTDNPTETHEEPTANPSETHEEPTDNPAETHEEPTDNRKEKKGKEKKREERKGEERNPQKEKQEAVVIFAFNSDRFREVWDRWERHRIEQHKPLGEIEAEQQQMKLARFSEEEAIEVIEFSIQVGARNLVLNGDHKAKRPKDDGSDKRFW